MVTMESCSRQPSNKSSEYATAVAALWQQLSQSLTLTVIFEVAADSPVARQLACTGCDLVTGEMKLMARGET